MIYARERREGRKIRENGCSREKKRALQRRAIALCARVGWFFVPHPRLALTIVVFRRPGKALRVREVRAAADRDVDDPEALSPHRGKERITRGG